MSGQTLTLDDYREFAASQKFAPDEHQTFTYDELDRLKTVNKTFADGYTAVYTYTVIGNLIGKTEDGATANYTYPANGQARPHAALTSGGNSYTYNANGDMLTRTENGISYTQQWDKENRLQVVTNTTANPDIITTFFYNGDGARVKRAEQNGSVITTTFYAGVIEVISMTQLLTKTYYSAGGQLIAVREVTNTTGAGTLTYLHSDHLGSTSTTTCGNSACGTIGAVLTRQSYYPYGTVRQTGNLPTDKTFTGQISDASTGLQYFNARYYSGALARFVSADTIVPGAGNPQALNRYMFVLGNPVKYTDPSGHDPWWSDENFNDASIWDLNYIQSLSAEQRQAAKQAFQHLLEDPDYFAKLYLDPQAWASSAEVQNLEIFGHYSTIKQGADHLISGAVYDKYGIEARDSLENARLQNGIAYMAGQAESDSLPYVFASGHIFVAGANGVLVPVPEGWTPRVADNKQGMVYQKPGSTGNNNMIRIGDPDAQNPAGYVRNYNASGQPLTVDGRTGTDPETHISLDYRGPIRKWPEK